VNAEGLTHHTSSRFDEDLERIRASVLQMGGLVERQLRDALGGIDSGDSEVVAAVAEQELRINQMERSIDEDCSRVLATRSPAATDLRLLIAVLKTITDLERIGDEGQKIATIAVHMAGAERPRTRYRELRHIGALVVAMVREALDAFARLDASLAFRVARRDRSVDEEYEAIHRQCITFMMEDPRTIRRALDVMWVVRSLERIGDHAKNICEYVIYTVHGKDVRHTRLEDAELDLREAAAKLSAPGGAELPPVGKNLAS
jgi:phosphate transport system protein